MKMNSILKGFLIKYFPAIILFIVKNYFGLDFLNDFNPFTSETKEFFNGNNPQGSSINPPSEGEGSNRQNNNNNTPSQDSSIKPPFHKDMSKFEEVTKTLKIIDENEAEQNADFIYEQDVDSGIAEIDRLLRDYENLRNQSQSNEGLTSELIDIEREINEKIEALNEKTSRRNDETLAYKARIDKLNLDRANLEKSINERNNK